MQTLSPSNFQTLSGPIYLELREQLITGIFEPGQRLKLNELAEQTGTSVSPVREALIRLVAEDSVEMSSLRAFAVPNLSTSRFEQIVAMRLALEGLAAERAAGQVSQADIKKLSGLHDRFIAAEQGGHRSKAQALNRSFHFLVYESAKMPILLSSISMLWAMMGPILRVYYSQSIPVTIGAPDHIKLIKALRDGDAKDAAKAISADIEHGCKSISEYIFKLEKLSGAN